MSKEMNVPSYFKNVTEVAYPSFSDFPGTGEIGKHYVALDTDKLYRFNGNEYVEFGSNTALNGIYVVNGIKTEDEHGNSFVGSIDKSYNDLLNAVKAGMVPVMYVHDYSYDKENPTALLDESFELYNLVYIVFDDKGFGDEGESDEKYCAAFCYIVGEPAHMMFASTPTENMHILQK